MAVTCTPENLATLAVCFGKLTMRQMQAVRIRLYCAKLNGETLTCDPATLLALAACYEGMSDVQLAAIETYLLCQIVNSG